MGTHPIFESDFDCLTEKTKMSSKEEIVQGFLQLCQMQRQLHQKLAEIKQERGEHELVADSLRKAEPERKAWRLVGGVLTERTVGEVLPALEKQIENLSTVIKTLEEQMDSKKSPPIVRNIKSWSRVRPRPARPVVPVAIAPVYWRSSRESNRIKTKTKQNRD